jgi:hypothetical protein
MEQFVFPTAETKDVISAFQNQSCVLLGNFVDAAALDRAYDMTLNAYARVDGYHIHPDLACRKAPFAPATQWSGGNLGLE